jgi:drug/metabolite transporter (DMT)-like permease
MKTCEAVHTTPAQNPVYLMLFTVVVFWGTNVVMIKYLTGFFSPTTLAALRLSTATAALVPAVLWRHGWVRLGWKDWLSISGIALFSIILHQLTLSWGLTQTSGTHAVLILSLNPLITTTLAACFTNEPFTWHKTAGVILGFGGIMLIVGQKAGGALSSMHGDSLVFIAMFVYVLGSLLVKKSTEKLPPLVVTAYSHIIGSSGLVLTALFTGPAWVSTPSLNTQAISVFLCSSLLATALGAVWWNTAIQRIGASSASLFLNISPLVGIFTSAIFLHELLNWQHFASLLLVLSGVGLGTGMLQRMQR